MADTEKTGDDLVVKAGYITVETQVGAGRARVDIPQGSPVPVDLSDEDRQRFTATGAIGARDQDPATVDATEAARAARPVPGVVEPDELPGDLNARSVDEVLAWVGDDLARARVARHEELTKGDNARQNLIAALDEVKVAQESEPPAVPEVYTGDTQPAPAAGGVTLPDDNPGEGGGRPADEFAGPADAAPAPKSRTRK